jgi:AraC-like DNA-binding protein
MANLPRKWTVSKLRHISQGRCVNARQPVKKRSYAESRLAQRCRLSSPHLTSLFAELAGFPREGDDDV